MSHSLIVGTTQSGKTTLAKMLCHRYSENGIRTLVLDPLGDPDWNADFKTRDADEFLSIAKQNQQCALFVDESSEAINKYDREKEWITTRSRHWGHKAHLIGQRATQINMTARGQCALAWIFWVGYDDAKALSQEFKGLNPDMIGNLKQLEFLKVDRFSGPKKYRIVFKGGKPSIEPA
jgi:hypothetical protein